jgi:hypothetical protein
MKSQVGQKGCETYRMTRKSSFSASRFAGQPALLEPLTRRKSSSRTAENLQSISRPVLLQGIRKGKVHIHLSNNQFNNELSPKNMALGLEGTHCNTTLSQKELPGREGWHIHS